MNEKLQSVREPEVTDTTCPSWCIAEHEHQGNETQRWHHSACTELPLVELAHASAEPTAGLVNVALPFDVALEQPWGSPSTYVLLGVGLEKARTFCLTLESAERLIVAMQDATRVARGCR